MNLYQVAEEIARRLGEHLPQGQGRPAAGLRRQPGSSRTTRTGAIASCSTSTSTATTGPASGASHQTGWTGVIARTLHLFATSKPESLLHGRQDRPSLPEGSRNQHRPDQCGCPSQPNMLKDWTHPDRATAYSITTERASTR